VHNSILAAGAKWSRANADVLVDTHWVGGDPGEHQVYGWASWTLRKGILVLRNPDDKSANIQIDIGTAFELLQGAAQKFRLISPTSVRNKLSLWRSCPEALIISNWRRFRR